METLVCTKTRQGSSIGTTYSFKKKGFVKDLARYRKPYIVSCKQLECQPKSVTAHLASLSKSTPFDIVFLTVDTYFKIEIRVSVEPKRASSQNPNLQYLYKVFRCIESGR